MLIDKFPCIKGTHQ